MGQGHLQQEGSSVRAKKYIRKSIIPADQSSSHSIKHARDKPLRHQASQSPLLFFNLCVVFLKKQLQSHWLTFSWEKRGRVILWGQSSKWQKLANFQLVVILNPESVTTLENERLWVPDHVNRSQSSVWGRCCLMGRREKPRSPVGKKRWKCQWRITFPSSKSETELSARAVLFTPLQHPCFGGVANAWWSTRGCWDELVLIHGSISSLCKTSSTLAKVSGG